MSTGSVEYRLLLRSFLHGTLACTLVWMGSAAFAQQRTSTKAPSHRSVPRRPAADATVAELSARNEKLRASKDHRKRLDVLLALVTAEPNNPDWAYQLGDVYFDLAWCDEAVDAYVAFAKRFESDPRYQAAVLRVEQTLRASRRYKEALAYLGTIPTPDADWDIKVNVRKADLLSLYDPAFPSDREKAIGYCQALIDKYPDNPLIVQARSRIAEIHAPGYPKFPESCRLGRAELQALIAEFPNDPQARRWSTDVGYTYVREKDVPGAIAAWEKVLADYPDTYPKENYHPYLTYLIGSYLNNMGKKDAAEAKFREVVKKWPDDPTAKIAKSELGEAKDEIPYVQSTAGLGKEYHGKYNDLRLDGTMPGITPLRDAPLVLNVTDRNGPITDAKITVTLEMADKKKIDVPMRHLGGGKYLGHADFLQEGLCWITYKLKRPGLSLDPSTENGKGGNTIQKSVVPHISPLDVLRMTRTNRAFLIDVGEHPKEWVKGAALVPLAKLDEYLPQIPKDKLVAFYDNLSEAQSLTGAKRLIEKGFRASVVFGGLEALKMDGFATEKEDGT